MMLTCQSCQLGEHNDCVQPDACSCDVCEQRRKDEELHPRSHRFAPKVVVHDDYYGDVTVEPPGWMWVLAFAIGGCEWAIEEADTEEFRDKVREFYRDKKAYHITKQIEFHLCEVTRLHRELKKVK